MRSAILGSRLRHDTLALAAQPRIPNANPNFRNDRRRKRSPANNRGGGGMVARFPGKNLVMGQVKILKRGEPLMVENRKPRGAAKKAAGEDIDLVLGSTDRLGPDPEIVKEQIGKFVDGMYAGSAFLTSPPPSSVPVPCFLGRRCNGAATNDLRRLLRLDDWGLVSENIGLFR